MRNILPFKITNRIGLILTILISLNSCEKTDENLKDPSSADKWTLFNTTTGLPGNQVRGIKTDSKNNIWFAISSNGAAKFSNNNWTYYNPSNSNILSNGITCIEEDKIGNIIFGTSNGISFLAPDNSWSYYRDPSVILFITTIKAASDGTVWYGTTNQGFISSNGSTVNQYITNSGINDIEEDSKGNIWVGTDDGLIKYDGRNFSFITMANGLPDNIITALLSDSKGRLWIGTYFGKKVTWLDDTGMHQLSLLNGDNISEINDIWEDRKGDIWFATYDSGLIRYDGVVSDAFKKYNGFPENDVISIGEDNEGNMWFGLYSKGLVKYTLPID
jgi:ligand-binding sensor domain-containing protein